MIALLFFVLLFAGLAAAGIAGWSIDSRDSRFSLWPLNRVAPDDPAEPAARPLGAPKPAPQARDYASQSAGLHAHRDTARLRVMRHASAERAVHPLRLRVRRRHAAGHAVPPPQPPARGRRAAQS
jgi:hypothetical protein